MEIKHIKTARNYRVALRKIEGLMLAKAHTPEGDRLDVLVTLVEAYERQHFNKSTGAVRSSAPPKSQNPAIP